MVDDGGMTITIEGLEALGHRLSSLGAAMRGSLLTKALRAGALPIQNAAKENAPVLSGTLRRSIHTEVESGDGTATARVGTNLPYARRIEYGFNGTDSRGRTYHQPARSYLRKAFDEHKADAQREAIAVIQQLLGQAGA